MTAMKPVLDLVIDANVVLILSFCLWRVTHAAIVRGRFRADFGLQLGLMRAVLFLVILSPFLSSLAVGIGQAVWPKAPITVGDLAVAAYLRGDIAMPAQQFEALLNSRGNMVEAFFAGELPLLTAVFTIVLAGSLFLIARTVRTMLRVRRIVARSYVWRRTASTDIRLSDTVSVPFATRGLLRRHVVLPTDIVTTPAKLQIVLAHEFEHLRQGDVEWELAFELLRPVLYFNPVFQLWKRTFDRLREMNCDQAVLRANRFSPRDYATCLLEFCARVPARKPVGAFNVAFTRVGSRAARFALEARLLAILSARQRAAGRQTFFALTCILAVGVLLAAASVRDPGDWSQDRLMLSTIVNLERLEAKGF